LLLAISARLPLSLLHGAARALGAIMARVPSRAARTTSRNVEVCFPQLEPADTRRLARASLQHSLCYLFEAGRSWSWSVARLRELSREPEGVEQLRQAVSAGRGLVLLAPHLGNWEIFRLLVSHGLPAHFLYLPSRWPALDSLLLESRSRGGLRMAAAGRQGVSKLLRALRAGELVGILPDQVPPDGSGVYAPFFAQQAYTMTLACKLAQRPGVRSFCGYAVRLPGGAGFRMVVQEIDLQKENLEESISAMNSAIEGMIAQHPEQYHWEYKRFRRQPDDSEFYPAG